MRYLHFNQPVYSLEGWSRNQYLLHLLQLCDRDRYLRFGYQATDAQIAEYVEQIDFVRDAVLGIFNEKAELIAAAHLALSDDAKTTRIAEFGVSVTKEARGQGLGSKLFERAQLAARNEGIKTLYIHALSENVAMLKIASKAGAQLERHGGETEMLLKLAPATLDSQTREWMEQNIATADIVLKQQGQFARQWSLGLRQLLSTWPVPRNSQ